MENKDTKIAALQAEIDSLKTKLEKYTNNERHRKYYEKNKERVKENAKQYLNRLKEENPDKLKEYRHRAYMKRKEKMNGEDDL
jgi:FtsZ-binding cell division protein ZapB